MTSTMTSITGIYIYISSINNITNHILILKFIVIVLSSYVHGRLPYDNIKPDPILRTLLLSLPLRKIVMFLLHLIMPTKVKTYWLYESVTILQIFTNADKLHAARALERLGLEDCFEGIVCFESLNSTNRDNIHGNDEIFDIITYLSSDHEHPLSGLPKTPIVCKPSQTAIVKAIEIANIDPKRTVSGQALNLVETRLFTQTLTVFFVL